LLDEKFGVPVIRADAVPSGNLMPFTALLALEYKQYNPVIEIAANIPPLAPENHTP
jgi:hypothetical protein